MIVGVTIVIMVIVTLTLVNAFAKRPFWELMTVPNALLATTPIQNANLAIALQTEHSWSMEYLIVVKVQRHNVLVWKILEETSVISVQTDTSIFHFANVSSNHHFEIHTLVFLLCEHARKDFF